MSTYLLMVRHTPGEGPSDGSPAHREEVRRWDEVNEELARSGELVWSMALQEPQAAVALVADAGGAREVRGAAAPAGVFAEYLLDVADEAAALAWARRMPVLDYGAVEVRAVPGPDSVGR